MNIYVETALAVVALVPIGFAFEWFKRAISSPIEQEQGE